MPTRGWDPTMELYIGLIAHTHTHAFEILQDRERIKDETNKYMLLEYYSQKHGVI